MITDADIILEARSWVGTPWKHGVARKGWGTDCGQFLIEMFKTFGWVRPDFKVMPYNVDYSLHNTKSLMREELERLGAQELADKADVQVGDVLLFLNGKCEAHTGLFIGGGNFVHAHVRDGVTISPLRQYAGVHLSTWRVRR